MKKVVKFLFERPILIIFIIIVIVFVPMMFVMQPQSQIKLIARTIGIDKVGDEIEIQFGNRNVKVKVTDVKETVKKDDASDMFTYM